VRSIQLCCQSKRRFVDIVDETIWYYVDEDVEDVRTFIWRIELASWIGVKRVQDSVSLR